MIIQKTSNSTHGPIGHMNYLLARRCQPSDCRLNTDIGTLLAGQPCAVSKICVVNGLPDAITIGTLKYHNNLDIRI